MKADSSSSFFTPAYAERPRAAFLVLLLLFVGSGCAALIYEIVWLQMLQLLVGSTAVSLAVLLGTFMGGMCLGSLLLPKVVDPSRHPLRVYAVLEWAIGAIGLLVLVGMPWISSLYAALSTSGTAGIVVRAVLAAIVLLPPTLCMGATLPAMARWVEATPRGISWLGFFYGGNIAGAVFGCLLTGFYLLRVYDTAVATLVAFCINLAAGGIAWGLSSWAAHRAAPTEPVAHLARPAAGAWLIHVAIGLSGMAALGGEVVWTRLLSLLLGGTVYTFSIILAVFLAGLGIGSSIGALLGRAVRSPAWALGTCQGLLIAALFWCGYMLSESLPYWPVDVELVTNPWHLFQLDFLRTAWAVLPAACLWGASFPLALAAVPARHQDPGRLVAGVYAANTVGAIVGAVGFSVGLVPVWGTLVAQRVLIAISAFAALLALVYHAGLLNRDAAEAEPATSRESGRVLAGMQAVAGVALAAWLSSLLTPIPWGLVAYGRHFASWDPWLVPGIWTKEQVDSEEDATPNEIRASEQKNYALFVGEGTNVSVAVSYARDGSMSFHGAGKVQASTGWQDMRLQRMLGHISALATRNPERVLVVACGAGVTAGSFIVHPEVKRIVICDIEPLVPKVVAPMFSDVNYRVVDHIHQSNPSFVDGKEVEVVFDDGRHFIRTTDEKFDVITSDPVDPWVKGCAALSTIEYYEMCKEKLNDGGVMTLWIPLYESDEPTVKSALATFFKVFPNAVLLSNDVSGEGYDAILIGVKDAQNHGYQINVDEFASRWERPDHARMRDSLRYVGIASAADLLATYAGSATGLQEWSRDAKINTDRNLRLQYLAGLALNKQEATSTLEAMLKYYRFPAPDLFVGSDDRLRDLEKRLIAAGRSR